jgi:chaperonin GroEL (HSP60 family)
VEDIQSIQQVATISSGNDEIIGSLIADALSKVGRVLFQKKVKEL